LLLPKLVEVYDEPFGDSSALPSLLLNKITKKYVTMAISGDGGDESFLGYKHFDLLRKFYFLYLCPFFIRKFVSLFLYCNVLGKRTGPIRRILRTKSMFEFIRGIFLGNNSLLLNRNLEWFTNFGSFYYLSDHYLQKAADLNIKLWLENDSNVKVDRASMAYSVEVRSPFLDYRLIEFARTLPVGFRYMFGKKKRILRDILKEYIPEYVFDKPKKGFSIPIGSWIRSDLKDEFQTNLKDEFLLKIPNFNVQKFKRMFDDHLMGKNDYSTHIWRVYILSRWYQEFGFYKREDN
jgi:asparagine synthase (glutamine-hydrolysing)